MPKPNLWTTPIVDRDGLVTPAWKLFFQSLGVDESAPGSVSGVLSAMQLLVANPLGQIRSLGDRGQQNFVLHGGASGYPAWGLVRLGNDVSGDLPAEHLNGGVGADGTTFWRGDETWAIAVQEVQAGTNITVDDTDPNAPIVASPAFAAPAGVIGFTAATGAAATVLRSDAAPALSNTLVTAADDNFSLATATEAGDTSQRGNITLKAGDNDTFTGPSLLLEGATPASNGGVTLTTQEELTVLAAVGNVTFSDALALTADSIDVAALSTLAVAAPEITIEAETDLNVSATAGNIVFGANGDIGFSATAGVAMSAQAAIEIISVTDEILLGADTDVRVLCVAGDFVVQAASVQVVNDGEEVQLGAGNDLRLFHDGTDSWVRNDTGMLFLSAGAVVQAQYDATSWDFRTSVRASAVSSPAQITSNQNDYAGLASTSFALRLDADAARDITGLAGGVDGRLVWVTNVGANTITFKNQHAGSTAANRLGFGADIVLGSDVSMIIRYDGTSSRWRAA